MAPKKQPLQPTTAMNIQPLLSDNPPLKTNGKTVEEMYQKKTQLEHILLRPDTYIGSIEKHEQSLWIYTPSGEMSYQNVSYVPGLYKIFDEILVNAADNKQRDPKMDRVEVVIDQEKNLISVYNTGDGIPVEMHKEEGVYVPELIFGHLLTSSNYNDNEKKTTGGRNGYGAKLTNIFSTEFVIETADGKRQLKYKQVFQNNMSYKGDPVTQKCKSSENWTKVTFKPDLAKFQMTHLEDDVVALMKKRVVDLAGCLAACPGKKVKVLLNGQEIEVKSFHEYAQLYLNSANKNKDFPLPRIDNNNKEDLNPRWQISISVSDGQFQQVSFVNNINTIKGGTHVDYITAQITKCVIEAAKKKNKKVNLKPHVVKNYLWIFVNALIDNPAFDSQTKETLTTRVNSFGTTCDLSEKLLRKVVNESGVVESLLSWADFKEQKDMKKTDGSKTKRLHDVPKLEDANEAGGSRSHECTLILTEGDSAKALAMAGLSVVGRSYYGVFPLRGKLLNVREASAKQITENAEINYLKKILGLKQGEKYDKENSVKMLRYGHLMIMADQDHDGSHIKGLVINFIHTFWPSLLKNPSFMLEFITPIVKASRGEGTKKEVLSFYTMPEYEEWAKQEGSNLKKKWQVKYYKGLGTSDSNEGKEYFSNLAKHRKIFTWKDDNDGCAIELAFSKKKIEARKDWLREDEVGNFLDHKEEIIRYSDFVHKELKLFSRADLQRSIPCMVDGLKPTQRKVLFAAFKRNLVKEIKVAQFSGYVSEKSAYHHGEASIQSTIIGMAQNFLGANNINFLKPKGQFGTRNLGGKDAASARYIHTMLNKITRFLFPKEDDVLLNYLKEDGLTIEPFWYMPIIPTVLVNGSEGIGTGWSTFIPNYNPRDIIANIRRLLNGEAMVPMDPWYHKFNGTIQRTARKDTGITYTVSGTIEIVNEESAIEASEGEDVILRITELPVRKWTQDYKEFLSSLATNANDKSKEPFIKDYFDHSTDDTACFEVILSKKNYNLAKQEGLMKKFKLTNNLSTSNMHLFDKDNKIVKYESPEQILESFFQLRLGYYTKRKEAYLKIYDAEKVKLDNQVRFILAVVEDEIVVKKKNKGDLVNELREKGFVPIPKNKVFEHREDSDETESPEEHEDGSGNFVRDLKSDFDYLLQLTIDCLTNEKVDELIADRDKVVEKIELLKRETEMSLWAKDLDALEKALEEKEKTEEEEAKEALKKVKASAQKGRNPRKVVRNVTKAKSVRETVSSSNTTVIRDTGFCSEQVKGNGRAGPKKAPVKKQVKPAVVKEVEEEEIPSLQQRLAAYHLDSSPEKSDGMETDAPAAKVVRKRPEAKKPIAVIEDISDDDDSFEPEISKPAKKGRGRPAKHKVIPKAATTSDTTDISPEKKVRRMRESPFNKKSGSVMNTGELDTSSGKSSIGSVGISALSLDSIDEEVVPARARPQRANRRQAAYVLSDSDSDDVQQLSSDNFSEADDDGDDDSDFE
ncbi:DNA topoisomerase 2 isoform X1 [Amaranthus tricolor]|uniref:DNA topoisomerase 2 isoform X1 n=1 Tax=Amaranthus tricolor TaxID=29722 RepID=UPI00258922B6|nr:DNA topoisomerase 2 isoform X1 [Amaranthus tricolor]XP_057524514.1 DNA topoisomerase 2 isoform X1 [Amaranthus tricolor]